MDGGERPIYGEFAEPQATAGAQVVEVRAAALSGLDRAIARRLHYLKMPDGPFVVGREGVARERDGRRIYFNVNAPVGPFGSMAERSLIDPKFSFPVPDGVADDVAAALGNAGLAAWLALSWRARLKPGETVLILGATGVSGLIAVTAAKQLGAGRVIAAGRNHAGLARAQPLGAEATVDLAAGDLVAAYRDAGGEAVDVVIDNVFGAPGEAALEVLALNGRLVHLGTMAVQSITPRGSADIIGFAYYHAPMELQAQAYGELCRLAVAGELEIDVETRPLSEVATAWDARAAGNRRRQVLIS